MSELCFKPARELARLIAGRKLSAAELVRAFIARIERVNPRLNAIVTFLPEQALAAAKALERSRARKGPLAGLPIAYKDLVPTKGVRTTFGSLVYRDHVPAQSHVLVDRLSAAGAILIGKTNTPEFGAGSQTFNKVFGATRNPYDLSKTCGGSSGGAAAAVAAGLLPFADGSDLAASLRNPGNYCNLVGLRPTPGRVPSWPVANAWDTLSVLGPIARTVADTAFLLSAMAGPDVRAPTSISEPGSLFGRRLARDFRKTRLAGYRQRPLVYRHESNGALREIGAFLWSEALLVLGAGLALAALLGWLLSEMLVAMLQHVFDPPPDALAIPWGFLAGLGGAAILATLAATWLAARGLRRLPLGAILREQ